MKLFIITGTTKGLGYSLAQKALEEGHMVISISRKSSIKHPHFFPVKHDLTSSKGLEKKIDSLLVKLKLKKLNSVVLINNAAIIDPIGPVTDFSLEEINDHMQVNLIAPVFLTGIIINKLRKHKCPQTYVVINSGAGMHPIQGWSLYCSGKSALRMFTHCLNSDYQMEKNYRFINFYPGVMDTQMQSTIRKQSAKKFHRVNEFKDLKTQNRLLSPDKVASALMEILAQPDTINKSDYDVRDFIQGPL